MKRCVVPALPFSRLLFGLALAAAFAFGDPPVLRWNPGATNLWDASTANWLDATNGATAWQPGAAAQFDGAGGTVNVAADVLVSNLTFAANGYTLMGAGRLFAEGTVSAAAATTNAIAAELVTGGGLTKSGSGALALARCAGPFSVQAGSVLASGSGFLDADLSVASGAALVTLGDPDNGANLLLNPGFELPALASGAWNYVSGGLVISNWTVVAYPNFTGRQNTTSVAGYNNPWNSAGSSPEGAHMLIMQYGSTIAQTVTVPADGLYSIAFSHLLRSGYPENQVYVALDGIPLATFLNRNVQFSPGRFASGALWLKAGSHTLRIGGEHSWGDRATMLDAVCFAPPSAANACRALAGDSLLKVVSGASVQLGHAGTVPLAYVALNGAAASGTFDAAHASGIFSGAGALSCAAPGNVYTWGGSGPWSSAARWADGAAPAAGGGQNLLLRFPLAAGSASTNDLAGEFLARRLWVSGLAADGAAALAGSAVVFTNTAPKLSLSGPGKWTITAPVAARAPLTIEAAGDVTFQGNALGIASNAAFYKSGPGTVAFPAFTSLVASAVIYEGAVQTPQIPSSLAVNLYSQTGKSAALVLTQGGVTVGNAINLMGSGTPALLTRFGGAAATLTGYPRGYGDVAVFDVGAGDTLSLPQMLLQNTSRGNSTATLLKAGAGTLEIRAGGTDNSNNRAYQGYTVLRAGTLKISEDDYGTLSGWTNPFNGRTYSGNGGSLGYSAFTNAVAIGDSGTAASDALALIANGNGRWVGHDIEIFNRGSTVTLGMTTGAVMFAGTIKLHRDIVLSGPADGVLSVSNVVAAGDFSGTGLPTLAGLAALRVEGSLPSAASLVMGARALRFGTLAVRAQTLNGLALGTPAASATLDVDFGAGANDQIAASQLMLSNTVVNLYYAGTGLPFAEPGTYTLFTYGGTLGGSAALLTVGNPQSGASYVFADDAANHRVTLTISGTSGGVGAVWKSALGGEWGLGANWDSGSVPDGAGVVPLFGLAITNAATVNVGSSRTAGGLLFNNGSCGYTLAGGTLTLATNGATPLVTVSAGSHTLDTTLAGGDGLAVATAANSLLILGSNAVANTGLTLAQGTVELRGNAAVNGSTALGAAALLRAAATNASVANLSGVASSALELSGTAPKVTVAQSSDTTFAGALKGPASGALVKGGAGRLTLNNPATTYAGSSSVAGGNLSLAAVGLPGAMAVASSAGLDVQAGATNGLTGYYYNVAPNTNNFWTFAGMESHFATLTPDAAFLSGAQSPNFDFGTSGTLFPLPYGAGGSRTSNFEAVYRGVITVPESGTYSFGAQGDDGFILAIDNQTVLGRNAYATGWLDGTIRLDAGRYDIVLGYFQLTGGYGLQLRVRPPSATAAFLVPSAWLAPYSSVGNLTGGGSLSFAASNAVLRVNAIGVAGLAGNVTGAAGSLLVKGGAGTFAIGGGAASNAFAGDVEVQAGTLLLNKDERVGDASTLRVRPGANLALSGAETAGGLAGGGSLYLGGYVYTNAFTGDADSDISTAKTYTHLIDFPVGTTQPVINGVTFGNTGAWSFSAGNPPTGAWNESPNDSSRTGIDSLLWDFNYGSTNFTLTLTGLTPNKVYEARLYFRNFASNTRNLVMTFTAGANAAGTLAYNPDTVTRSIAGCRYTADASGSLSIRVVSLVSTDTCHLYGLSNEEVAGATDAALVLAPPAGASARFTGAVSGRGSLTKAGAGTQTFAGTEALTLPLAVQQGTLRLESGAVVTAGVAVAAGAVVEAPYGGTLLGGLTGQGTFWLGATPTNVGPYFVNFTNDIGTGISASKVYTHLLDFGSGTAKAIVNGIAFEKTSAIGGAVNGYSWTNIPPSVHSGGNAASIGVATNQGIYNLLFDMNYGTSTGTVYLSGLTIGKLYEVRIYHRCWDIGKNRSTRLVFDPDGTGPISDAITFNPDAVTTNDNYLGYRYLAATNYLAITIQSLAVDKYHLYGLSNEETYDTLGNPVTLNIAGSGVFGGALSGLGGIVKAGGGSFAVTGASTATGPVAVNAGAFGAAGGGCATRGPVSVAAGATVFGDGLVGGSVAVASNGWLQAGTAAACGTLQIGGDLTLAPGARLAYRFNRTGGNDTVTVGGLLTFPTNGVVLASALEAGAYAPAKDVFFTSAQVINGPATLSGWTVQGVTKASLTYSDDRKTIYFSSPRGTLIEIW